MTERETPKTGRPTKLDDLRAKRIVDALAGGNTRAAAAAAAGVSPSTLRDWCARGRAGEEPFAAFLARVKKAEGEAEAACVAVIRDAMPKTWQAAAWWLERRRRSWRRRDRDEAPGGGRDLPADLPNLSHLSDDELRALAAGVTRPTIFVPAERPDEESPQCKRVDDPGPTRGQA